MKVGLVGCVKSKRGTAAPARDLYTSALFRGRRRYVELTCDRWFILSARHGLVEPEEILEPYDEPLTAASLKARRCWSERVLEQLCQRLGVLRGLDFEIHAGAPYYRFGLAQGLEALDARWTAPTEGLPLGKQLAFCAGSGGSRR